jgi:hypothetical protein
VAADRLLELRLDAGHLRFQALLVAYRQLLERLGVQHLAVAQRCHSHAGRGADDHDAFLSRATLDLGQRSLALLGEAPLERLAARPVVVAVESGRDRDP